MMTRRTGGAGGAGAAGASGAARSSGCGRCRSWRGRGRSCGRSCRGRSCGGRRGGGRSGGGGRSRGRRDGGRLDDDGSRWRRGGDRGGLRRLAGSDRGRDRGRDNVRCGAGLRHDAARGRSLGRGGGGHCAGLPVRLALPWQRELRDGRRGTGARRRQRRGRRPWVAARRRAAATWRRPRPACARGWPSGRRRAWRRARG